jgi:hypothetical protein
MPWLKAVSVLALRVRGLLDTVRPIQPVGPVNQVHTTQTGNLPSVLHTNHQPQPALTQPSLSNDHALSTSTEQKLGSERRTVSVEQVLTAAGSKLPIPVRQHLQPAKQALKLAKKVASKTKVEAKHTRAKATAQIPMVSLCWVHGN